MTTTSQPNSGQLPGTKSSDSSKEKSDAITFVGRNVHDFFDDMPWFKLTRTAVEVDTRGVREKCKMYPDHADFISTQSAEILCHIFSFLPIQDVLKMQGQNKKMQHAVMLYLKLLHSIDFGYGEILSTFPSRLTDSVLMRLMEKCPHLENIYGFHPPELTPRRFRNCPSLSVPGCIDAFLVLPRLQGVEISDPALFEAILTYLPHLRIIGAFKNRASYLSKDPFCRLTFPASPNVTMLNLTGVTVPEIPRLTTVRHLFLHCIHLTHPLPFRDFLAPMLETFVMANCAGPSHSLKYVSLFTGLAAARNLSRLELIRVPFLGGIFQHIVEDSWRVQGFQKLRKVTMGACKFALEVDLGFLAITAAQRLEEMLIQPSLARDSFFSALKVSEATFPNFQRLTLGHIDFFGQSKADRLILADAGELFGISEVKENPALITDMGMAAAAHCFPALTCLTIRNCPHLHLPHTWLISGMNTWANLQHLSLYSSHAMGLESLESLVAQLRSLTTLFLESMFREPPKGCSRVGLSAGTGLGVSAALVQNHNSLTNHANGAPVVDAYASEENDSEDSDEDDRLAQEGEYHEEARLFRHDENVDEAEMMEINNNNPIMEDIENSNDDGRNKDRSLVNDESRLAESRQGDCFSSVQGNAGNENIADGSGGSPEEDDMVNPSELVKERKQLASQPSSFCHSRSGIPKHELQDCQPDSDSRRADFHSKGDENLSPCCSRVCSQEASLSSRFQDDAKKLAVENQQSADIQATGLNISNSYVHDKEAIASTSAESPWQLKVPSTFHSEDGESKKTTLALFKEETQSFCCSQNRCREHDSENNSLVDGDDRRVLTCDLQDADNCKTLGQASSSQALEEFSSDSDALSQSRKLAEETSAWLQWDSSSEFDELHHSWDPSFPDRECPHSLTTSTTGDTIGLSSSAGHMFSSDGHFVSAQDPSSMPSASPCRSEEKKFVVPVHISCKSPAQSISRSQKTPLECASPAATSLSHRDRQPCSGSECNSVGSLDFLDCGAGGEQDEISPTVCDQLCFSNECFEEDTRVLRHRAGTSDKRSLDSNRQVSSKHCHGQKHDQSKLLNSKDNKKFHDQALVSCGPDEMQSLEEGPSCPRPRAFKGKGLMGRKKSIAKRSRGLTDDGGLAELPCPICSYRKDKWCQASNDEIRDSIRRAREQEESAGTQGRRSRASSSGSTSSSRKSSEEVEVTLAPVSGDGEAPHAGAKHCDCLSGKQKGCPIMVSKATSTSDPVYEEDHVQVLKLHSDSLVHVTLRMVGITDLMLTDCPRLKSVRGSACRVLCNVRVERSLQLRRMHWAQCTKLDIRSLLQSACQATDGADSTIFFLRPMMEINEEELTQELLTLANIKKHVCMVFDYSPNPSATLYNHHRMENWAELFHGINSYCLDNLQFPNGKLTASDTSFISRRGCYSLKGFNCDESNWRLTTDFPWLWHLSGLQDNPLKELPWYCQKAGLFCKEMKGHTKNADCTEALMPVLRRSNKVPLYQGTIFIYINMCDVTGIPTHDIYV